jgi:hypothetical protein
LRTTSASAFWAPRSDASSGASCARSFSLRRVQFLNRGETVSRGEMGIASGHGLRLVAHEFLHGREVDAAHDETARERVAEIVPMEVADLRGFERRREHPMDKVLGVERGLAGRAGEHPFAAHSTGKAAQDSAKVVIHRDVVVLARLVIRRAT